jgi:hypothetical protein
MNTLLKFIAGILPTKQEEEPKRDEQTEVLSEDQVAYLHELADERRRVWASEKRA